MLESAKYLRGIEYHPIAGFSGIFSIAHPRQKDSIYCIGTYEHLKNNKAKLFNDFFVKLGLNEKAKDWDLHHIVEKTHLKSFYKEDTLTYNYKNTWPVVLLYNKVHHMYKYPLEGKEVEIIYDLSTVSGLKELYNNVYYDDFVLRSIALNVLNIILY